VPEVHMVPILLEGIANKPVMENLDRLSASFFTANAFSLTLVSLVCRRVTDQ
jgi:hypothetical protein